MHRQAHIPIGLNEDKPGEDDMTSSELFAPAPSVLEQACSLPPPSPSWAGGLGLLRRVAGYSHLYTHINWNFIHKWAQHQWSLYLPEVILEALKLCTPRPLSTRHTRLTVAAYLGVSSNELHIKMGRLPVRHSKDHMSHRTLQSYFGEEVPIVLGSAHAALTAPNIFAPTCLVQTFPLTRAAPTS